MWMARTARTNGGVAGAVAGQGSYTIAPLQTTSAITYTSSSGTTTSATTTPSQYDYYNAATGSQTLANGALFGGTGTVVLASGQTVTLTGLSANDEAHLAPGLSTGVGLAPETAAATGQLALTLGSSSQSTTVNFGAYSALDVYLNGAGSNILDVFGNVNLSGTSVIDLSLLSAPTLNQLYPILSYTGTLTGTFDAGASTITVGGYTFDIIYDNGAIDLEDMAAISAAYYNGTNTNLNTAAAYDDGISSGNPLSAAPIGTTNVFFGANRNASSTGTVTSPLIVNSLNFGAGTGTGSGMVISASGSGEITINASTANGNAAGNGITIAANGGSDTISAPIVLGASQSWTPTSSTSTLTVSGQVSDAGNGYGLTKLGAGTLVLSNAGGNTYSGGTTVSAGKLLFSNTSNSATGTGTLTVNNGATVGGATNGTGRIGTSISTSFALGGLSTTANVIVGNGTDATSSIGIQATGAGINGTITNTNLTFNLDSASTNANVLDLGSTNVAFSGSTLTLNLLGSSIIKPDTAYILITDSAGFNSATDGLMFGSDGQIISGLSLAGASFGPSHNGFATGFYQGSYLFVSGDNIEVEVVPEPGTWALVLGGLCALVFLQRRRSSDRR